MADVLALTRLGVRKCAILMIQMGQRRASAILSHLSDAEAEAISLEISRLEFISPDEVESVLIEFLEMAEERSNMLQGGLGFAQQILEEGIGGDRASAMIGRLQNAAMQMPFHFLHRADPEQLRTFTMEEHPQIVAMVLAHMNPDKASVLLGGLDGDMQADIAHRIAVMERISPEISRAVEQTLERRLASMLGTTETSRVGGVDPLVEIINRSDRSTERQIVEGLEEVNPILAEEVRSRMFMFEDIVGIENKSVQLILRAVDNAELALAMKGISDALRDKIMSNLSERAQEALNEEIEVLGAVRVKQVEEAQANIIRVIRKMEEAGDVILSRGAEDELIA